jgi:2-methylcitrate dehydratase PrpD
VTTTGTATAPVGQTLGAFAASARLDDAPADVQASTRLLLLDTLGALLGGLRYAPVRRLGRSLGLSTDGPAPFGLLLTLGTAATWLDADSGGSFHPQGHRLPPVPTAHPCPHVLPVLMRAAAADGVDDRRLLEVFLVADEVGIRAGTATSLRPGLHPHGVHGPGAAAVAAGLLRSAPAPELGAAWLLGSSLPLAATLDVPVRGGTVRNAWTGLGSWYGAAADLRAAAGEPGDEGLWAALFDGAVTTDLSREELLGELGSRWQLASSYLKPYACARWVHPTLDAVTVALASAGLRPGDPEAASVQRVEVDTFAFAASLTETAPGSDLHARFSVPTCVAALLLDGDLHAGSFLDDALDRPALRELAARVVLREDAAATAALPRERPAAVAVHLADGRTLRAEVRGARGNPDTPLGRDEVVTKLRRNAGDLVPATLLDDLEASVLDGAGSGSALAAVTRAAVRAVAGS